MTCNYTQNMIENAHIKTTYAYAIDEMSRLTTYNTNTMSNAAFEAWRNEYRVAQSLIRAIRETGKATTKLEAK